MIRPAESKDTDEIVNIWYEASVIAHSFVDSTFWDKSKTDMEDIYIPNSESYVYEDKEGINGFISLSGDTLAAIFVKPGCQGKGIGKKMLEAMKGKRKRLILSVYKENYASIMFYKKNGFRITEERTDSNTGHPEYVMVWEKKTG